MKARCIQNGQAWLIGGKKPRWCEVGQELDIDVKKMGGLPKHFEAIKTKAVEAPTTDDKAAADKAAADKAAADKAAADKAAADKAAADKAASLAPGAPKSSVTTDNL